MFYSNFLSLLFAQILDGSLSTVAGSPVDPRSKAVETVVVQEKNNPRSYVSFLDDGSSDFSLASNVPSLDQSEVHVGQPKFDETGIKYIRCICLGRRYDPSRRAYGCSQ